MAIYRPESPHGDNGDRLAQMALWTTNGAIDANESNCGDGINGDIDDSIETMEIH